MKRDIGHKTGHQYKKREIAQKTAHEIRLRYKKQEIGTSFGKSTALSRNNKTQFHIFLPSLIFHIASQDKYPAGQVIKSFFNSPPKFINSI
jgi:hypothetical protein